MPEKLIVLDMENEKGALAEVGEALGRANVTVEAVAGVASGDEARLVLLTSDVERAFEALRNDGFTARTLTAVVLVTSGDAGELGRLTRQIAEAGVDVTSAVTTRGGRVVLGVDDYEKAREALAGAAVEERA